MKKSLINYLIKIHFILILLLATALPTWAYSPLNTDDAGTVGKGKNQVEQYFFIISQYDPNPGAEGADSSGEDYRGIGTARGFPFIYSRGLSDNLEINFSPTYYASPAGSFSSFSNYTLAMKWRFDGDGETGWNFAIKPLVILPASQDQQIYGVGNALLNAGLTGIASRYWEQAELHINMSYMRAPYNSNYAVGFTQDPNRTNLYAFSVAPVWVIAPAVKFAMDVGINTNPNESEQSLTTYAMLALIYSPSKDIDIGIAYQKNTPNFGALLTGDTAYTSRFQSGITWRFD